jgi:hypothetical protein
MTTHNIQVLRLCADLGPRASRKFETKHWDSPHPVAASLRGNPPAKFSLANRSLSIVGWPLEVHPAWCIASHRTPKCSLFPNLYTETGGRAQGREDSTGRKLPFYWTSTCSKYISSYRLRVGYAPCPDSRMRTGLRVHM